MKDAIGNEIKVGDLVALQLQMPVIRGRVIEVIQGGIITGMRSGKEEVRPTVVMISANFPIEVDPRHPVVGPVMCLREDDTDRISGAKPEEGQSLPN